MEAFIIGLFKDFGAIPTILAVLLAIWFFMREIKKEFSDLKSEIDTLKEDLDEVKRSSNSRDQKLQEMIDELKERIAGIEREYVTKEDHYKDLGGWREEIKEIRRLLIEYVNKGIIK